jgi:hypothetical protein
MEAASFFALATSKIHALFPRQKDIAHSGNSFWKFVLSQKSIFNPGIRIKR